MRFVGVVVIGLAIGAAATAARSAEPVRDPRDGRTYPVVQVGTRQWFAVNLAYAAEPSWCFGDEASDCEIHGRLYPWATAVHACPAGWRLPDEADWRDLESALGMPPERLGRIGPGGTDQGSQLLAGGRSGLAIAASGYRRPGGEYVRRGERAALWSATPSGDDDAWHRDVRPGVGTIYRSPVTRTYAMSVRCVR